MIDFINAIQDGKLVLLAVADEAGITFAGSNQGTLLGDATTLILGQLLEELGSTMIRDYCWQGSWTMVTIKGAGVALAEEYQRSEEARAEPPIQIPES